MRYLQRIIPTVIFGALCIGIWLIITGKWSPSFDQNTTSTPSISEASLENLPNQTFSEKDPSAHLKITPANIVWFSNYARSQNNLRPLIQRKALNESAKNKNNHMFTHDYFAHTQPKTSTGFDSFIDQQHYQFIKIGENLAMGDYTTSQEIVDAWMKSDSHRKNILDPDYTEIGVHVATGMIHGKHVLLITQHFGRPLKTCPVVNENNQELIKTLTAKTEHLRQEIILQQKELGGSGIHDKDYETRISEYNTLVESYNTFVNNLEVIITAYNKEVVAFDACAHNKK